MNNLIYLIGYRGVGKSSVGMQLASLLNIGFFDMDLEIIRRKDAAIEEIVEKEGWQGFRESEKEVLASTGEMVQMVVATGGGAVLHRQQWQKLRQVSTIFWLRADIDVVVQRLLGDTAGLRQRPSLTGSSLEEEVRLVLKQRDPLYEETAHYQIDTTYLDINGTAERIYTIMTRKRQVE